MVDNKDVVMGRKRLKQFLIIVQTNDHHKETIWTGITKKKMFVQKRSVQNLDLQRLAWVWTETKLSKTENDYILYSG